MNVISRIKQEVLTLASQAFGIDVSNVKNIELKLNVDRKEKGFGDISFNGALLLARELKKNPRELAQTFVQALQESSSEILKTYVKESSIAGPGFINITLTKQAWQESLLELFEQKEDYFALDQDAKKLRYLIEFVSANPTGPLHLGAGRNGIIGDVLGNVLKFLGHDVHKEYYINDAGNQIKLLGKSLYARCLQALGEDSAIPEGGYQGEYLKEIAQACVKEHGDSFREKSETFFIAYAKDKLLELIKKDLKDYGIVFDQWFSEKSLHDDSSVEGALALLQEKDLAYEHDGALWFKATLFGDDKDRVIRKKTGNVTYVAADIAYHKHKFDRGFDKLIDILGQDHHGYVARLKATMQALGYGADKLDVILYQLVSIKENQELVKMSKRAGTFTKLSDIIKTVGKDVARFFYLNRKAEAHLEFDLAVALKKTEENPVFYIQYAYVRTVSLLAKAAQEDELCDFVKDLSSGKNTQDIAELIHDIDQAEIDVIKKVIALADTLRSIANSYGTHLLAYYAFDLAHVLHNYYAHHRIIDTENIDITKMRLVIALLLRNTLQVNLELLGLSCPEKM